MHCFLCLNTESELQRFQKNINDDTVNQIAFVLPEFVIPEETEKPIYICDCCIEQLASFYSIKIWGLNNLCRLRQYEDLVKEKSDFIFNELKVTVNSNEKHAKPKQDIEFKIETNPNGLLLSQNQENTIYIKEEFKNNKTDSTSKNKSKTQFKVKEKRFQCSECPKKFPSKRDFNRHIRLHTGQRPFECLICYKTFTRSSHLQSHKLIHSGVKNHKCEVCLKTFTRKSSLTAHERIHNNDRPYQCEVCNQKFIQLSHLSDHLKIHSGQKAYECKFCEYKCIRPNSLKIHIRRHTGSKPYVCKYCENKYISASILNRHIKNLHSEEII